MSKLTLAFSHDGLNTDGTESDPSNLAAFTVAPILRKPSAPFGLAAEYSR